MRQRLGQHWMTSMPAINTIVDSLLISPGDTVVEIGPGRGALTEELRKKNGEIKILAIEKDEQLARSLQEKYAKDKNIRIIHGDVLEILPLVPKSYILNSAPYKLLGNIPYYITGAIIRCMTELTLPPTRAILTMQREVAERLTAKTPRMNLLAAIAQNNADITVLKKLPRGAFSPPPKVESAIVLFENIRPCTKQDLLYHQFIRLAFAHPRKMLLNNLRPYGEAVLEESGIGPKVRAGEMNVVNLRRLFHAWMHATKTSKI